MRKWALWPLGLGILVLSAWSLRLIRLEVAHWPQTNEPALVGAFHVHTEYSHDSRVPLKAYLQAARALGHRFIVVTDHDAPLWPPLHQDDMLVLRESELSSIHGHVIAMRHPPLRTLEDDNPQRARRATLGLSQPRDLTAELRDEKHLKKFGLWPIIAHPTDAKRPWTALWPSDGGIEVANAASALREVAGPYGFGIVPLIFSWMMRHESVVWPLWRLDTATLKEVDAQREHRLVGLCGVDAHGWMPLIDNLRVWNLQILEPNNADLRPEVITQALMDGRFHCVAGLGNRPPDKDFLRFDAEHFEGEQTSFLKIGDVKKVHATKASPTRFFAGIKLGADGANRFRLNLLHQGVVVAQSDSDFLMYPSHAFGSYRVLVETKVPHLAWGERWAPVLLSGPIHIEDAP